MKKPTRSASPEGPAPSVTSCSWGAAARPLYRPTWAEIDTRAFLNNFSAIKARLNPGTGIMAVVKANAYGHLAVPLSKLAVEHGAAMLGVSSIEEGIALRDAGVKADILLMGSIFPMENLSVAAQHRLVPTISSLQGLAALEARAVSLRKTLPFHLKIDTGMGRVGVSLESAPPVIDRIAAARRIRMTGLYMHFAAADTDPVFTRCQLEGFRKLIAYARKKGLEFAAHAANSSAILMYPKAHFDMVRPGVSMYGLSPYEGAERKMKLDPVLSWKTRIVFLKKVPADTSISYCRTFVTGCPSVIATLPVGYADGYSRKLSNRAAVVVRGTRCPVVGRVSMDMTMVDVTRVPGVSLGDEVVLIGEQGKERVSAEEIACLTETINYETTCGISYRVPRVLK